MNELVKIENLGERVISLSEQAKVVLVKDRESLEQAQDLRVAIKKMRLEINDTFDSVIKKAHETHREAIAKKKKHTDPLDAADRHIEPKIAAYFNKLEEQRREAEKRERERLEAEKKAEEEQIQKAIEAEENGDLKKVEEILDQEPVKLEPVAVPEKPVLNQGYIRKNWKFRITDPEAIPRKYLKIDEVKINKIVRILKDKTDIPGIEAYPETSVATRVS